MRHVPTRDGYDLWSKVYDADANPLVALESLVRQAAVLVRAALEQAAAVDPAQVLAQLAEAEAARQRAEALASAAAARCSWTAGWVISPR